MRLFSIIMVLCLWTPLAPAQWDGDAWPATNNATFSRTCVNDLWAAVNERWNHITGTNHPDYVQNQWIISKGDMKELFDAIDELSEHYLWWPSLWDGTWPGPLAANSNFEATGYDGTQSVIYAVSGSTNWTARNVDGTWPWYWPSWRTALDEAKAALGIIRAFLASNVNVDWVARAGSVTNGYVLDSDGYHSDWATAKAVCTNVVTTYTSPNFGPNNRGEGWYDSVDDEYRARRTFNWGDVAVPDLGGDFYPGPGPDYDAELVTNLPSDRYIFLYSEIPTGNENIYTNLGFALLREDAWAAVTTNEDSQANAWTNQYVGDTNFTVILPDDPDTSATDYRIIGYDADGTGFEALILDFVGGGGYDYD